MIWTREFNMQLQRTTLSKPYDYEKFMITIPEKQPELESNNLMEQAMFVV